MYETGKTEENPNAKGLALLINKNFTDYVENFEKQSDRIISCKIKLHGKTSLQIIQVYAPTCDQDNETVELFYEELEKAIDKKANFLFWAICLICVLSHAFQFKPLFVDRCSVPSPPPSLSHIPSPTSPKPPSPTTLFLFYSLCIFLNMVRFVISKTKQNYSVAENMAAAVCWGSRCHGASKCFIIQL